MDAVQEGSTSESLAMRARSAMREQAWADALNCWNQCLKAADAPKPNWLVDRAQVLQHLGKAGAATEAFAEVLSKYPELPDGVLGLARIAMQRQDWKEALARWDECLNRFRDHRDGPWWLSERARVLTELGDLQGAEDSYTKLIAENPENIQFKISLLWLIINRSRRDGTWQRRRSEILLQLRHPSFAQSGEAGALGRIDILIALGELSLARQSLAKLVSELETFEGCDRCFSIIPLLTEFGTQGAMLEELFKRLKQIAAKHSSRSNIAAPLELGLLLALGRFTEFVGCYDNVKDLITSERDRVLFAAVWRRLGLPRMKIFNEPKVFGIGLSKTGTTSLSHALDLLGIDNGHYTNPLTRQLLSDVDFFMLGGATDTPVSNCFEKLFDLYPNAKFVLTTRPMHDWLRSMQSHYAPPVSARNWIGAPSGFQYGLLGEEVQVGLYLHHDQYERAAIEHERRVRHFFTDKPADRLLVFNVWEGHGWSELCGFLGKPHPQKDFPWSNRRPT